MEPAATNRCDYSKRLKCGMDEIDCNHGNHCAAGTTTADGQRWKPPPQCVVLDSIRWRRAVRFSVYLSARRAQA
ncbi:MAG: hypothetical protein H6961_07055 [Chromatiaceae bacterium]|nr:hypothetical protein [Chromatiaceae bacterium]